MRLTAAALIIIALMLSLAPALADPAQQTARDSGLVTLHITTQSGDQPGEAYQSGQLAVFTPDGADVTRQDALITIRVRGNNSKRFPKLSWRVNIVNESGEKRKLAIAGLRSDDDWILNPMYSDTSKIREALAYELWEVINSSGQRAASSRLRPAHVYLNGAYWGLYGVQERVDRKQVAGDKSTGILYKVDTNRRPTVSQLLACDSAEQCEAFELDFAGKAVTDPWLPAAGYMAFLDGEELLPGIALSQDNVIDYGLWMMLTQAHDCHFKNQFLHCVRTENGYTLYKTPWDLNNTLGDVWRTDAPETNHTAFVLYDLVLDGAFKKLLEGGDPAFIAAVQNRWAALRQGEITQEKLIARAHALYDPLFDAVIMDAARWPNGGMGEGNARNIRDIEAFFADILPRMDAYIANLGI